MTTYTIYAEASSLENYAYSTTTNLDTFEAFGGAGSYNYAGAYETTRNYEGWESFDTSGVVGEVQTATLSLYGRDLSFYPKTGVTAEARAHAYGATLDSSDWRTRAQLGAATLLASFPGTWAAAYNDFTSNGSNLAAAINQSGNTQMVFTTDAMSSGGGGTPGSGATKSYEWESAQGSAGTTKDPKLVVTAQPVQLASIAVAGSTAVAIGATREALAQVAEAGSTVVAFDAGRVLYGVAAAAGSTVVTVETSVIRGAEVAEAGSTAVTFDGTRLALSELAAAGSTAVTFDATVIPGGSLEVQDRRTISEDETITSWPDPFNPD